MTLTHKGIEINYNTFGKGEPLVFLHGFLENATMWNEIIPYFQDDYYCITIDLLGHGQTPSLGYIHTMEDMAKAVVAVLGFLNLNEVSLIGHSMGGYVSLACIDLFPNIASRISLLNSTSFPDSEERKLNRSRAIETVKKNPKAYTNMAIANLFAEENRAKFVNEIRHIKEQASKTSLQGIISALEGMKIRKDRRSILENFQGSRVILSGLQDPVLPYTQNLEEATQLNVDLISFDGGHMSYIENKKDLINALKVFLK